MNIISAFQKYGVSTEAIDEKINDHLKTISSNADTIKLYEKSLPELKSHTIVRGKIVNITSGLVIVDISYKSEGSVPLDEFNEKDKIKIGDEFDFYIIEVENELGVIVISKAQADRMKGWDQIVKAANENTAISGKVVKKTIGGYLVDVGALAFLPSSQVDIRRNANINLLNQKIECKIIKIDNQRRNVIVSRKIVIEQKREEMKKKIFSEMKEGDVVKGVVKNIADFGAFVDLGGLDALLHIGDMSWRRISHPSEIVVLEKQIDVKVLKIDPQNEKIFVGLKQLTENPWGKVVSKYEPGVKVKGKATNILPYGVFVELEPGIEGLLHISEMSWTKINTHPSEIVAIGDIIEVVILKVNVNKQEISLGMKQLEANVWVDIEKKYTVGMKIQGRIKNVTPYGAFIEIEEGIDGLIHQSDMVWTMKTVKPSTIIKKGDKIEAVILSIDPSQRRVSLGIKQLSSNPWETTLPEKYPAGKMIEARILKLSNKGLMLEIEPQLNGLLPLTAAKPSEEEKEELLDISFSITADEAKELQTNQHIKVEVVKLAPKECVVLVKLPDSPRSSARSASAETRRESGAGEKTAE
ncbi:MAG: 30S ribosomal protein S1 [Planctomycetota bacterium]|nr:30S ribosomal protein S1 [Planctomycetota bacterium]MDI6787066.1 30S ribosomal protein S1 [Planctomycetota bacterium]